MSILPQFPKIPELDDGQILGATYLNALARGCEHLLGISHACFALPHATDILERYESSWGDMATYWMPAASRQVAYGLWVGNDSAGKTWYIRLQYYGSDDTWHTVGTWSGTETFPHVLSGVLDLSGETYYSEGYLHRWAIQGRTSDETYHTCLQVMLLCTRPTLTGWTTPSAVTGGSVSDAETLNTWRDDLIALNTQMVSPTNALSYAENSKKQTSTSGTWEAFSRFAYRYRPNGLEVGVWGKIMAGSWAWRVRFADSAGHEAVIYTSDSIPASEDYSYHSTEIDLTSGETAAALAAAGITLTFGTGYVVTIETKRNSDEHALYIKRPLCVRTSNGTPGGSWTSCKLWEHKDCDVGPTELNKIRTDLLELYTGGAEELWGESHAARYIDGSERSLSGVHAKQFLNYRCVSGKTPTLLYGEDFSEEYSLPQGEGWLSFDLSDILVPGGYYYVLDVETAFEANSIYGEA